MAKAKKGKKAKKVAKLPVSKIRVAFIGAGNRAQDAHYPSIHDMRDAEICAICELNEDRLQSAAKRWRVKGLYTSHIEMIEQQKPDIVYAIMPPHHLYDTVATTMEMGCNIVVEKPPSVTTEQARQMTIIARRNKVLTAVTTQRRFAPIIRTGKEACEAVGPVHTAEAQFVKYTPEGARPIYQGAVDLLTVDGVHAVDTLRYLCGGEVESVASDVRRIGAEHQTVFLAMVRFSSGATGFLKFGYKMGRRIFSVEAHSDGISFYGDPEEGGRIFTEGNVKSARELDAFRLSRSQKSHRAYGAFQLNRHIIDCVRDGRQPETNLDDALKTMELVEAILRSQI